jgi:hypothetical protein
MPFNAQIIPVNARALRDEYTTRPVNHKIHPPFQEFDNRSSQHDRVEANLRLVFAIIKRFRISTYYLSHTFLHRLRLENMGRVIGLLKHKQVR